MRKVFFCGDPHGEFDHILSAIREYHPQAVVLLGDLTPSQSLNEIFVDIGNTQIFWIPGNHDSDSDLIYDRIWRSRFSKMNLHGKVLDVGNLKIAGLGGVFRGQIWMPPEPPNFATPSQFIQKIGRSGMWRGGLPRRHRTSIFESMIERMSEMKADVLVTHEAPAVHAKGFSVIDDLAKEMGVKYIFHAHQHQSRDYGFVDGIEIRGIGLRGIVDLEGNVIVPAQKDPRELPDYIDVKKREPKERKRILRIELPAGAKLPPGGFKSPHHRGRWSRDSRPQKTGLRQPGRHPQSGRRFQKEG